MAIFMQIHHSHVVCINHQVYAEGDPEKVLTSRALLDTFGLHMGMVDLHKNCHCSCTSHVGGNEKC